jgi:hypothetical protein
MSSRKLLTLHVMAISAALLAAVFHATGTVHGQAEYKPGKCVQNLNCTNCIFGILTTGNGAQVCQRMNPPSPGACILAGGATTPQNTFQACAYSSNGGQCNVNDGTNPKTCSAYYNICGGCASPTTGGCDLSGGCTCPTSGAGGHDGQVNITLQNSCTGA